MPSELGFSYSWILIRFEIYDFPYETAFSVVDWLNWRQRQHVVYVRLGKCQILYFSYTSHSNLDLHSSKSIFISNSIFNNKVRRERIISVFLIRKGFSGTFLEIRELSENQYFSTENGAVRNSEVRLCTWMKNKYRTTTTRISKLVVNV